MKPEILLDIDGVVANFIDACLSCVKLLTGRDYTHDDVDQWLIEKAVGLDEEQTKAMYADVVTEGWCRNIPPYEVAKIGVAQLREFADVIPVTAHFFDSRHWVYERDEWIVEHLGIAKKDIINTHRKYQIDGDMLIDDKTSHLVAWAQRHPKGVAVRLRRKYNEHEEWATSWGEDAGIVANDWPHVVEIAKERFCVG